MSVGGGILTVVNQLAACMTLTAVMCHFELRQVGTSRSDADYKVVKETSSEI
jgi:hypothetical protein